MSNIMNDKDFELLKKTVGNEFDLLLDRINEDEKIDVFRFKYRNDVLECFLQGLIKAEFEIFIRHNKDENYKNGKVKREISTSTGISRIDVPRDRQCKFHPASISKYSRSTEDLSLMIIELINLGLSYRDITTFLDKHIQLKYSKSTIPLLVDGIGDEILNFKTATLKKSYFAVFIDATYIPVKLENSYEKHAVHILVAITEEGYQEILAYKIGFNENNTIWAEVLDDIIQRGVRKIEVIVSDGFIGIDKVIKTRFPEAKIQRCTFHVLKNIKDKMPQKHAKAVLSDFSNLYKLSSREVYETQKKHLVTKWNKYTSFIEGLYNAEYIDTYLDFPSCIQKTIRTSNRVESVNQKIKTRIGFKRLFQSIQSLEKILIASFLEQNNRSTKHIPGMKEYIEQKKYE